jgi:type I restriction enzyme, S subunit
MSWATVPFERLYAEPSRNGVYKSREYRETGIKIVNMGELFAYNIIGDQDMERITLSESELTRFALNDGDLLFGRRSLVEAGAGKCALVEGLSGPTTFESSLIRVRLERKRAQPRFYLYWFQSHQGKAAIHSIVTGTNVKGITSSNLRNIRVVVPPIHVQDNIVEHIRNYDDLIANNRRRIQLLEQAARHIYKEWFVRLRFPGHEHTRVVEGVPVGWTKKTLGEIATLNYGKGLIEEERIPGAYPVYGSSGIIGTHDKPLVSGPGIIVGRKGNAGSVFWSDTDFYPIDTTYFINSQASTLYLYYALLHTNFINTDVAVPGLNRDLAHSRTILMPATDTLNLFEEIVTPMYKQISTLQKYCEPLAQARDLLLPRLMNGTLDL